MRFLTTLATAATVATLSTTAFAGGMAEPVMEAPVEVMDTMEPAGSSVNSTYIIVGVLAALLIAAAVAND